ncbi:FAD linked oxidase [Macleaya cordata]|uniref:L-gulonolactone oxidase n=1 Tax=Macleaya cordata TaxID=56857 RepID=A0A200Q2P0_MACCD|nr:FAD linked oxidase [Macleaya cordata]
MAELRSIKSVVSRVISFWSGCIIIFVLVCTVTCIPPEDPINCSSWGTSNCTITNSYGAFPDRSVCKVAHVVYPKTEQELLSAVAMASKNKIKVKVATRYGHGTPKLVCPDGHDGLVISTRNLNRVLKIDKSTMMMTVETGATLKEVVQQAAEAGLALPHGPYWWGLTVGGMISTGAHGSGWWGVGSSVHEYVEQVRIVTPAGSRHGYAKVRTLDNGDPHINAAKVSLGVLGVISQVTLRLQPLFKRSITFLEKSDSDLAIQTTSFGNQHEFGDITWFPVQHKAIYRVDDRLPSNVSGNGLNDFIGFRSTPSTTLALVRSLEESQESTSDADGKCRIANLTMSTFMNSAYGFTNNGTTFTGYPIVGYQHRLQTAGSCLDSTKNNDDQIVAACPWDPRVKSHQFFHQTGISIRLLKVKNFIKDVKKLRDLEPKAFCGVELYGGILMRYVKASNAYLGKQEDAVDFDISYYRSKDPKTPRLFEDILEEVEQLAVFKYGGLPHWGKNRNVAFVGVTKKYKNVREFLKVKKMYDPLGIFSNKWTDQVLGLQGGVTIVKEGCALEGLCICSEDIHCAPKKGYFCRPGRVYKDARVCSYIKA